MTSYTETTGGNPSGSPVAVGGNVGTTVASASSITLAEFVTTITGSAAISTINGLISGRIYILVPDDTASWSITTAGNVKQAVFASPGVPVLLVSHGSYIRVLSAAQTAFVSALDFGAKGDGHTDDTAAVQAAGNAASVNTAGANGAGIVYFPPTGKYGGYLISSVTFTGNIFLQGSRTGTGALDFDSTIIGSNLALDTIIFNGSSTWGVDSLTFRDYAGWANNITGATSTTIVFDQLFTPTLTAITAPPLEASFTVLAAYSYFYNAASGQVYRTGAPGTFTATVGGTLPTHTSGTATVAGTFWVWVAAGTTYSAGDFGWGQQWYFSGSTSNSITGVIPAPGQVTWADPAAMVTAAGGLVANVAGGRGYFSSLHHFSSTTRTTAMIYGATGQDPVLDRNWFYGIGRACVRRGASVQGGIWTHNTFDGMQWGVYGDLTNAEITVNRFFGHSKAGIFSASTPAIGTGGPKISNNFFQLATGPDIWLDDGGVYGVVAAVPDVAGLTVGGSAISDIDITDNKSNQGVGFLNLRGVAHLNVENNQVSRCGRHAIRRKNTAFCNFRGNQILGWGEKPETAASTYAAHFVEGSTSGNLMGGETYDHLNAGQGSLFAVLYDPACVTPSLDLFDGTNRFKLPAGTAEVSIGGVTKYARTLRRADGMYDSSFVVQLFNGAGATPIQHAILSDGVATVGTQWAQAINGALATLTTTPDVSGGATAFAAGAGFDATTLVLDTPVQTTGLLDGVATLEFNNTTADWRVEPILYSSNVNGVTKQRLAFKLRHPTTGVQQTWATVLGTDGYQLRVRFRGRLEG